MAVLKSKNIILRPYSTKDAQDLYENFNDIKIIQFMTGVKYPFTLNRAKKWIKRCQKTARKKPIKEIIFVIEKNKKFVGSISLKNIEKHKAEIGYWVGRLYWNQGIMTEAIKTVVDFSFKKLKLDRLYAYVFLKNKNSVTVLIKNKFKKEGLLRKHRIKDGEFVDMYLYARIK
ncbi:GNAT family N-acetyltransferase [Candidatus Woesearchaeota archaeon]|nr:GNAT family N-acetyltransferase [Candidatus Woesearchaeota archaeon]